jgi:hypothetical protein
MFFVLDRAFRFIEGMTDRKATAKRKATARARATAGPSTALRFAQDDSFVWVGKENGCSG